MRVRALIGAAVVAGALLPALALVASADEDPPLHPEDAGPPLRPPLSVLRAIEKPPLTFAVSADQDASAHRPKRQLIVLVGGYASESDDETFTRFRKRLAQESGYDVVRFGHDLGAYDTFGEVDGNAQRLRDSIRSVPSVYDRVHIVTHSMGGVVADRAFALGLSASDGVTTYVAWAAPHDGAHAAQAMQTVLSVSGPAREDTRSFTKTYFRDPDTAAVRDLARADPSGPQPGIARLDLRLATDALVSSADARNPGVESRVLVPTTIDELEGHGGILKSQQAFDLTVATITSRSVPPDQRGRLLVAASEALAQKVDGYAQIVLGGVCGLVILGGIGGLVRRTFRRTLVWPPFSE